MSFKMVVLSGLPGSGKSTLAESVAEKINATILSVDPIESAIIKSGFARSEETGLAAYHVAEALAGEQLKLGKSVVIDAVNPVVEAWQLWSELSEKYDVEMKVVECVLDTDTHRQRIENRTRNLHGIPEVTWEDIVNRKQGLVAWSGDKLVIDTAKDASQNVENVLAYIN